MTSGVPTRAIALVGLAVLGVGLAWAGTALGGGVPVTDTDPSATFTVSEDNVTLSNGDRSVTVIDSMAGVEHVEIAEEDAGRFEIRTETSDPFSADERRRAIEIARDNETVRRYLDRMGEFELVVEPIVKLEVGSARTMNVSVNRTEIDPGANETFEFTIEGTAERERNDSVSITRDPSYVEDTAIVRVTSPPDGDVRFSIHVDLANETVVGITDWDDARSHSRAADPDAGPEIVAET